VQRVTELFPGRDHKTKVWVSALGEKEMAEVAPDQLLAKLEYCAEAGFWNFNGEWPLRREGDGVWAFGIRSHLARIAGYFPVDDKSVFVIGGAYLKRGQDRGHRGDSVCDRVAQMKREGVIHG